ncbi:Sec-independent protein translocase subunit TatA [Kitasatospora sp. NPDC059827]|uniref:Sec-independent protein translocase subunit TatA n=1 Tax=Kitasatospora sp. NPDC059827 TaxID=3346964 RepID=UPI00365A57FB
MRFSMTAIVVVVVVAVVLFGAKRLPDLARSLGQSLRILKSEARAMRSEDEPEGSASAVRPSAPQQVSAQGSPQQGSPQVSAQPEARIVEPAPGAPGVPGGERPH